MSEKKQITVVKRSGEKEVFRVSKLKRSLERSGADKQAINKIVDEIEATMSDGMTTKEIYKKAFGILLKSNTKVAAARYKLKKAIMELGPTGFPFEKFVAAILNYEGYKTNVGVIVKGHCVNHEVDVMAEKGNNQFMVECKFHNEPGTNSDVKIPLYIHSRFRDIEQEWKKRHNHADKFLQGWIFTNTRFTEDAIKYGNCAELKLVSWDYPKNRGSLRERIDSSGLHPVTSLTTLTIAEKQKLLTREKVLCIDLYKHPELLKSLKISAQRQKKILTEVRDLCEIKNK